MQVHPGLFAAASPWLGGEDFKDLMLQVRWLSRREGL